MKGGAENLDMRYRLTEAGYRAIGVEPPSTLVVTYDLRDPKPDETASSRPQPRPLTPAHLLPEELRS